MGELDIYKSQGFAQKVGFGEQPAVIIVDFVVGFTDAAVFGGGNIRTAIEHTRHLLAAARKVRLPIAHTRIVYAENGADSGAFARKVPSLKGLTESNPASQIVQDLTPADGELVIRKRQPSAFFETGLIGWLMWNRVDTLIIAGCTTSGCVRATVVDAMSHNLRTIVALDCVGDRAIAPHDANLFDMEQKYADLMRSDEIIREIEKKATRVNTIAS